MEWYLAALRKYADFGGRARRKEYWMFFLFNIIISLVLAVIDGVVGTMVLGMLYSLAVLVPGLAVTVRRLHDLGKSGWWLLIALVPILGAILLLVWMFTDGEPGTNQYGPNPKSGEFGTAAVA